MAVDPHRADSDARLSKKVEDELIDRRILGTVAGFIGLGVALYGIWKNDENFVFGGTLLAILGFYYALTHRERGFLLLVTGGLMVLAGALAYSWLNSSQGQALAALNEPRWRQLFVLTILALAFGFVFAVVGIAKVTSKRAKLEEDVTLRWDVSGDDSTDRPARSGGRPPAERTIGEEYQVISRGQVLTATRFCDSCGRAISISSLVCPYCSRAQASMA